MSVMTATRSAGIPRGRPFTVDDLDAMPDDGNRYELIDGMLVVSPAPGTRHQNIVAKLVVALDAVCPSWVVDPQAPSVTVFELVDGRYEQAAEVKDTDVLSVERPFPVRIVPRELLGTLAS